MNTKNNLKVHYLNWLHFKTSDKGITFYLVSDIFVRHGRKGKSRWQKFPATCGVRRTRSFPRSPAQRTEGSARREGAAAARCHSRALPGSPGLRKGDKCQAMACQKHRKYLAKLVMMLWGFPLSRPFMAFSKARDQNYGFPPACVWVRTHTHAHRGGISAFCKPLQNI